MHSRPQVPKGTWGFVLLLLIAAAACEHKAPEPVSGADASPIGLRLEVEGLPALEAAVLLRPVAEDKLVVGPLSGLLGQALKACKNELTKLQPGKVIALAIWLEGDKLSSSFDAKPAETLRTCLYRQLDAKKMGGLSPEKRNVDIQIRLAPGKRP